MPRKSFPVLYKPVEDDEDAFDSTAADDDNSESSEISGVSEDDGVASDEGEDEGDGVSDSQSQPKATVGGSRIYPFVLSCLSIIAYSHPHAHR